MDLILELKFDTNRIPSLTTEAQRNTEKHGDFMVHLRIFAAIKITY